MKRVSILLGGLLVMAGCGANVTPANVTPDPAASSMTQGRFVLSFAVDRATVRPGDAVIGTASLAMLGPGGATITGSSALFGFGFTEIGGSGRQLDAIFPADCGPHRVTSSDPIGSPIVKSGAVVDGPNADWYRQFLQDPIVHLPPGEWDVAVSSAFWDGPGCSGPKFDMLVTVRVHVRE